MPYFVYRISAQRKLTLLNTFDKFIDAKDFARSLRSLRAQQVPGANETIRMIFAENPKKAQLLLTDLRNPKTDGDD